jgi:metal-sulfur cluster biosynthetic enzyme
VAVGLNVEEVKEIIQRTFVDGMSHTVHPEALDEVRRKTIKVWEGPMENVIHETASGLDEVFVSNLHDAFAAYKNTQLIPVAEAAFDEWLKKEMKKEMEFAHGLYETELEVVWDKNWDLASMSHEREAAHEALKKARLATRLEIFQGLELGKIREGKENGTLNGITKAKQIKPEDLKPDPFSKEIQLVADVQAYYKIAAERFAPNICQRIKGVLFKKCKDALFNDLKDALGLNREDGKYPQFSLSAVSLAHNSMI